MIYLFFHEVESFIDTAFIKRVGSLYRMFEK